LVDHRRPTKNWLICLPRKELKVESGVIEAQKDAKDIQIKDLRRFFRNSLTMNQVSQTRLDFKTV
jgi:hypothetical protein